MMVFVCPMNLCWASLLYSAGFDKILSLEFRAGETLGYFLSCIWILFTFLESRVNVIKKRGYFRLRRRNTAVPNPSRRPAIGAGACVSVGWFSVFPVFVAGDWEWLVWVAAVVSVMGIYV